MTFVIHSDPIDTPVLRKERGAFFTPAEITRFICKWAIRAPDERVLEPSAGDDRLRELAPSRSWPPTVHGVEIHAHSAEVARKRVSDAGGKADIQLSDFFSVKPDPELDVVIGNPPIFDTRILPGK